MVQGAAAGGGFALALAADIRIATKSARMNCASSSCAAARKSSGKASRPFWKSEGLCISGDNDKDP
jgi:1,4-dihydroxy-2-naphthoyl-CoA synthase